MSPSRWRSVFSLSLLVPSLIALLGIPAIAAATFETKSREPYAGAIVVDAGTGRVLFDDGGDRQVYPASVVKLMNMLVALEHLEAGRVALDDQVVVTAEAARMGGSQVFLAEKEKFSVDDLLYALMISSANDAAVALAVHIGGSRPAYVELMNERAQRLGMTSTVFHTPHGLPPSRGQKPDVTSARDIAILARAVLDHPGVTRYTSTRSRPLRGGKFVMYSHNHLLKTVQGCDGLKTGYYAKAGYSVAATAMRDGRRVITVVLGARRSSTRDRKAAELMELGFKRAEGAFRPAAHDSAGAPAAASAAVSH